ncbi:MAG: tRNA uridine-5-carboxymethylaminomethyl(34) synthesis GTPase MnmE [Clostridia bacterium]|nr:tRNA uridine-5-carboxymethylaminomethyl(34) synthesis GTPase MnmE [Clostridia bacterium]
MQLLDTIAAISTPHGKGGVAMLRISGEGAIRVAAHVFRPASGQALDALPPRHAAYGQILAPDADPAASWVAVDDGIATIYRAPASFTGEDTVEICCHGGILMTQTVLQALLAAGARAAEAGEFTRRAYLNGKMGLSAAQSLGALLEAENRAQLTLAHAGIHETVEKKTRAIYEDLRAVMSQVLVCIDFPEEDLADMGREEMYDRITCCAGALESLAGTYRTGHAVAEGIPTVICGQTNVGKSSLYNRLVGRDAAIVTEIAGTTRDILQERVTVGGEVTLLLQDTAGLRQASDTVEKIGIDRAHAAMDRAELILAVFDGSRDLSEDEKALVSDLSRRAQGGQAVLTVCNKSDLTMATDVALLRTLGEPILLSAATGSGLEDLTERIRALFIDGQIDMRNDAVIATARQHAACLRALSSLRSALSGLQAGVALDLCCVDIEGAMSALSELDGRAVDEDIVNEIFAHFCVGK